MVYRPLTICSFVIKGAVRFGERLFIFCFRTWDVSADFWLVLVKSGRMHDDSDIVLVEIELLLVNDKVLFKLVE